jgi:hypothetical protein
LKKFSPPITDFDYCIRPTFADKQYIEFERRIPAAIGVISAAVSGRVTGRGLRLQVC